MIPIYDPIDNINIMMKTCSGCYPIYQPNQMAHMDFGGCLFIPPEILNDDPPSQWSTLFGEDTEKIDSCSFNHNEPRIACENECCICFEYIQHKNSCVTECGHKFCLKCLMNTMYHQDSWCCPYCRTTLIEQNKNKPEQLFWSEDETDYGEDSEEDNDDADSYSDYDHERRAEQTLIMRSRQNFEEIIESSLDLRMLS